MRSCILGLAALTVVGPSLAAQERGQSHNRVAMQDVERGRRMLRQLRETLDKHYYDSTYGGFDLEASQRRTDSALGHAETVPEIAGLLAQFLHDLDDSHTRFYPPGLSVTVDYGWRWQMIGERCYVMSVREDSDAAQQQLQVGDRVLAIDGISLTRQNASLVSYVYHTLSPRAGMRLELERVDGTPAELVIESSIRRHPPITDYTDLENRRRAREEYERSSRIAHRTRSFDSVLVWKLPRFGYQDETIDRVMRQARDHRWLVLDLRDNPGGAVEAETRLLGHFFPERFIAYAERWRDSTVEQWIEPQGSEPYAGEVVVLLNSRSASAAEITARVLQMRGRGTVVGDRSAGAVMTSYGISLTLGSIFQERVVPFGMSVTISDVIMPDGGRLEKTGVVPNIGLLPTGQDLAQKRDPTMAFALEMAGVAMNAEETGKLFPARR